MSARDRIFNQIKKKEVEIQDLKTRLREAEVYIQGLRDAIKYVQKDQGDSDNPSGGAKLKAGSNLAKARDYISKMGKPLHVEEILKGLNQPINKKTKVSLAGSLNAYAKNGRVFVRFGNNVFGIDGIAQKDDLPENFGLPVTQERLVGK